ncbi:hypothetical protein C0Q70_15051 [Pomacea canaliculata]|uniref:Large ribosomal subunit protein mL46 n=2 Tax=Pomacea canaliculata TaxID=400727 RepID=A0A2T7NTQ6_POMCA|nr:hypothetical protein C0Q70_15051 [Pomacea canaliculata]
MSAVCTPGQWDLVSAVCIQRPPVISAEKTNIEHQFASLMSRLELDKSLLSDHELRIKADEAASKKHQESLEETERGGRLTAFDLEDEWEAETKLFSPASRVTEADKTNDRHSVERKLDQTLVLLVKHQLGDKAHWLFPQGPYNQGESMRQAAERVLTSLCGNDIQATFLGNAPCGFYQYQYPPASGMGTGAKVFFFKAWYQQGNVVPNKQSTSDFLWVTKDELSEYCPKSYLKSIKRFLANL